MVSTGVVWLLHPVTRGEPGVHVQVNRVFSADAVSGTSGDVPEHIWIHGGVLARSGCGKTDTVKFFSVPGQLLTAGVTV